MSIEKLEAMTAPETWTVEQGEEGYTIMFGGLVVAEHVSKKDTQLIVALRNLAPELIAVVRAAQDWKAHVSAPLHVLANKEQAIAASLEALDAKIKDGLG